MQAILPVFGLQGRDQPSREYTSLTPVRIAQGELNPNFQYGLSASISRLLPPLQRLLGSTFQESGISLNISI